MRQNKEVELSRRIWVGGKALTAIKRMSSSIVEVNPPFHPYKGTKIKYQSSSGIDIID